MSIPGKELHGFVISQWSVECLCLFDDLLYPGRFHGLTGPTSP